MPHPRYNLQERDVKVDRERRKELLLLQRIAKIRFNDINLLNHALAHRSYANERRVERFNNERLEFLGDSVLGVVVTEYLFLNQPQQPEGYLAMVKSHVVSEDSLAQAAREMTLENYILIGKGEELSGGRTNKALISDALEALFGAYYLDSGLEACRKLILNCLGSEIHKVLNDEHQKDYKTILQELVQQSFKTYPRYLVTKRSGPEHRQQFWVKVQVMDNSYGPGRGHTKKEAEKAAAQLAYKALHKAQKKRPNSPRAAAASHKRKRRS